MTRRLTRPRGGSLNPALAVLLLLVAVGLAVASYLVFLREPPKKSPAMPPLTGGPPRGPSVANPP